MQGGGGCKKIQFYNNSTFLLLQNFIGCLILAEAKLTDSGSVFCSKKYA